MPITDDDDIGSRLNPPHLQPAALLPPPTNEELKANVEDAQKQMLKKAADEKLAKLLDESGRYTFDFKHVDRRKREWTATFTSIIPSLEVKNKIAVSRAQLSGGVPFSSIDPIASERFYILAHLLWMTEVPTTTPKDHWSRNLLALRDDDVLGAIWEEVALHERTFFGRE